MNTSYVSHLRTESVLKMELPGVDIDSLETHFLEKSPMLQ